MPTVVLGSNIFEVVPTVQASGNTGGDQLTISAGNTIPSIVGGAGAPSGTPTYGVGSLYVDTTNLVLYINTTGSTWASFVAPVATASSNSTIAASSTNASFFPVFVSATSGNLPLLVDAAWTYNPSTNTLAMAGELLLATGTATVTPVVFTSGTLNTTPVAGGMEFNGNELYFSAVASNRALVNTSYYFRNNAAVTFANSATTASWQGLTNGVTLQANTVYEFEGEFQLSTTGTTSHTESILMTLTTATVNNIGFSIERMTLTTTPTSTITLWSATAAATVVTAAITTAQTLLYRIKGTVSIATGGQFRPDLKFSAAPGATSTIAIGAWFRISQIGASGANSSIGTWS